jgi:protein-S-isoprenylcysteine O-methyltransferase Ste14
MWNLRKSLGGLNIDSQVFFLMAFIFIFSLLSIMRLYFRIVTGDIRDGMLNRREGLLPVVVRCIFGIPLFAAVVLYIRFPDLAPWSYCSLPLYLRNAGIVLGSVALYSIYRVHVELGRYFSSSLVIRKGHRLVRSGPYRLVRHPMYTSYLMLFTAAFLISENWLIGISGTMIIASLMTLRIVKEEDLLLEYFGEEYKQYRQTTGMFLPLTHKLSFRKEPKKENISL